MINNGPSAGDSTTVTGSRKHSRSDAGTAGLPRSAASQVTSWIADQLSDIGRRKPGSVPGEVSSRIPDAAPVRIRVMQYDENTLDEVQIHDTDEIKKYAEQKSVTWVNVDGLRDSHLISEIGEIFQIHGLILEDVTNPHQRAKVETYDDQTFIVARMPEMTGGFDTEQISMVLCHNVVITFQERTGDCLEPVRERLRNKKGRIRSRGHDYLVYALLDAIIDAYFPVLARISERLNDAEQELTESPSVDVVTMLQRIRTLLFMIQGTILPHQDAVAHLLRDDGPVSDDTRLYLRDCADHVKQVLQACETTRELAADLRDYCFAEISFNQNETMKTLTVMASVFIPLGFIAGFYGMNFDPAVSTWNMPETRWRYGYVFAIGLMVLMVTLTLGGLWQMARLRKKARKQRFQRTQRILD